MFGPVTSQMRPCWEGDEEGEERKRSFLVKVRPCSWRADSTVGCRPPTIIVVVEVFRMGRTRFFSRASEAKEVRTSSSSSTAAFRRNFTRFKITDCRNDAKTRDSSALIARRVWERESPNDDQAGW